MSSRAFRDQRLKETVAVYKYYNGDRRLYAIGKRMQEEEKRRRQTQIPASEVNYELSLHQQKFPRWFDVHDGTDRYCSQRLMSFNDLLSHREKSFEIPVNVSDRRDMFDILKTLLERCKCVDSIAVGCSFDDTTVDVPQKLVLMQHDECQHAFPEYLKHQERPLSPFVIHDVVGGKFDDPEKAVLVTKELISHTRYLYKDWSQYQFHHSMPNHEKQMKLCFGVVPETVSVISIKCGEIKLVLYPALAEDKWKVEPTSVLNVVDTFCFFEC
jgi:phage pi2 protein 07